MREILFRGKRIDNGEWVEGSLILTTAVQMKPYIVDSCWCPYKKVNDKGYADFDWLDAYEVDPDTVGQFTGLADKNGKRIFEDDVLKYGDKIGYVNFGEGCFSVKYLVPDYLYRNNPAIDIVFHEYPNEVEVIGNIHDNPELLEG